MSKAKKAVKQVAVKNMAPITRAVREIDTMQGRIDKLGNTKFDLQNSLADLVLKSRKAGASIASEHKRLLTYAKGVCASDGLIVHHDKNIWSMVGNLILQSLASSKTIKATAGKNDKGRTVTAPVKVSELPVSARAVATNASAIRQAVGMGDKRSTNAPKTRTPRQPESAPQVHSTATTAKTWGDSFMFAFKMVKTSKLLVRAIIDHKKKVVDIAGGMGYLITIEKK